MKIDPNKLQELLKVIVVNLDGLLLEIPAARMGLITYRTTVFQKSMDRIEVFNYKLTQWLNELSSIVKEETGYFNHNSMLKVANGNKEILMYWERCRKGSQMVNNEMQELMKLLKDINEFNAPLFEHAKKYEPSLTSSVPKTYGSRRP